MRVDQTTCCSPKPTTTRRVRQRSRRRQGFASARRRRPEVGEAEVARTAAVDVGAQDQEEAIVLVVGKSRTVSLGKTPQ